MRDVQATLAETLGDQAAISKSTVSEVCKAIRAEYQAWARRRLDEIMLDYLFLDASFFRMHPGSPAEPVLAAWGITTEGKPVFVGLAPVTGESTDAWADFLTDLGERGLGTPLLLVSDGAKGLIAAIEQIYPKALRQRCLIHRLRNVLAKIPTGMGAEVRDGYWAIFDTTDLTVEPGPGLVEIIDKRIEAFAAILWNQNCQVHEDFPVRICTIGSMVAVAGVPSSRGVGPAGVGTSASRSSSAVTAVCPSSTAARSSSVSGMLASMR